MDWYPWIVLAHILGAFGFVLGHGVSAHVAIRLRGERDPARIAALLDLSSYSMATLYLSLLVLLASGIAAGFLGGYWGRLWIWSSIGVLVLMLVVMFAIASPYYGELRRAVGLKAYGDQKDAPPAEPLAADQLALQLETSRPYWLAAIGGIGLVVLIGLMYLKPF